MNQVSYIISVSKLSRISYRLICVKIKKRRHCGVEKY
jgi:hypothetical protein